MARALRLPVDGLTYHVTARGNDRQRIFDTDVDHLSFLALVEETRVHRRWRISAWCLMVNHFHLLVTTETFDLSAGLRDILGRYARRYNHFHERTGHLFGRRFHSVAVTSDEQFFATLRYVNRNPVRARMTDDPAYYPWTGYARSGTARPPITLDESTVLERLHPIPAMARRRLDELIRSDVAPGRATPATPRISALVQAMGTTNAAQAAVKLGYRQREVATALGLTESCLSRRLTESESGTSRTRPAYGPVPPAARMTVAPAPSSPPVNRGRDVVGSTG